MKFKFLFFVCFVLSFSLVFAENDEFLTSTSITEDVLDLDSYNAESFDQFEDELSLIKYEKSLINDMSVEVKSLLIVQWNYIFQIFLMVILYLVVRFARLFLFEHLPNIILNLARGKGNEFK